MSQPVELHGAETGNCFRASIALEEAEIAYRVHLVDLASGQQRSPEYLRLNPAGKVPTLVARSPSGAPFILSQSNAIILWADAQAPGQLAPRSEGPDRIRAVERFFYFVTDVIARSHAAFALRRAGMGGDAADALDDLAIEALSAAERFVTEAPYMAGDRFSMADIAAFTIASTYESQIAGRDLPMLARWRKAIGARVGVIRGLRAFANPSQVQDHSEGVQ